MTAESPLAESMPSVSTAEHASVPIAHFESAPPMTAELPLSIEPPVREHHAPDDLPIPAHRAEAPPPMPRNMPDLPPVSLSLPPDSGLELVETTHKEAIVVEPEPDATRPKRVRPPRHTVAEEPLQLVETRKDAPPAP
jgi:hypothetical protein